MSHFVAFFGNDPERVECALFPARQALYSRGEPNGWGLGFAQAGDVLLQKRPRTELTDVDFFNIARPLRAEAIIARVGSEEEGRASAENTDPHRFRAWLFGTIGSATGFDQVRDRLLAAVPDFLRRNIRGRSPGEHLFHVFLAFLHDAGLLDIMSAAPDALARALRETANYVDRLLVDSGLAPLKMSLVATNGRCMLVEARNYPVQFLQIDGIADCPVCQQKHSIDGNDRRIAHEALRAVIVEAGDRMQRRSGWQGLPEASGLVVGPDRVARVWPQNASV